MTCWLLGLRGRRRHKRLIGVAPQPILARLYRAHDLMLWCMLARVPARMLVLRGIAASHLAIGHAHTQVNPGVTKLETLLAASRQRFNVVNLIKMRALRHCLATHALEGKTHSLQQSHERVSYLGPLTHQANSLLRGVNRGTSGLAG